MPRMNAEPDLNAAAFAAAAARARAAAMLLARSGLAERNQALLGAAEALLASRTEIIAANQSDLASASGTAAFQDRLLLNPARIAGMAAALREIAALPDPLDRTLAQWTRPNGMVISRVPQPIGVIGMIYESRPNVGADAAALAIKSGNAILLRGGSESFYSGKAINAAIIAGLRGAGLPETAVQIAETTDRGYVAAMLAGAGLVDLIIPRGGRNLVERVQREARVPVLAHAEGLNHTYIHQAADFAMARNILANAKMRRTGVCGATETLLIDRSIAAALLPLLIADLAALGCDFRADEAACAIVPKLKPASKTDFDTEWLDAILNVAVVDGVDAAVAHITAHGSEHTEAIITENVDIAEYFLKSISSAVGLWNASTQFCDGGEFGFGGEIGIATGRVQARGPVGLEQLTTFRYIPRHRPGARLIPRYGHRYAIRIGLLGGSFNPAHEGHLHVARAAMIHANLDQLWLMVSPGNPLKPAAGMAPLPDRLASARRFADGRRIIATDIERHLRTTYTAKTLAALRQKFPRAEFVWLMGADNLSQLPKWKDWLRIANTMPMLIVPRPNETRRALAGQAVARLRRHRLPARAGLNLGRTLTPGWILLPGRENAASATALRQTIADQVSKGVAS